MSSPGVRKVQTGLGMFLLVAVSQQAVSNLSRNFSFGWAMADRNFSMVFTGASRPNVWERLFPAAINAVVNPLLAVSPADTSYALQISTNGLAGNVPSSGANGSRNRCCP